MPHPDLRTFVRTEHLDLDDRELLRAGTAVLIGVSAEAAEQLRKLQITSVFDLALSRIFLTARQLTTTPGGGGDFVQFGAAPSEVVNQAALSGKRVDELQFEPTSVIAGIGATNRASVESALGVTTVRDLAFWPPYEAARVMLRRMLNPAQETGFDPEAPADLLPGVGQYPTERVIYNANFLIDVLGGSGALTDLAAAGPVALSGKTTLLTGPATGAVLTFSQKWFPIGLSLGQLLYSMPLAPGESTKLAVIDWRRRTATSLTEDVSQTESLASSFTQSRAIAEVVQSVATEVQSGRSTIDATASSASIGASGGALVGGPALVGGTASGSQNTSTTTGVFSSQGQRDVSASMQQQITDSTHQQAFSSRNRHASTVAEAVAEERESISTRTVSNYNHMHAMTVQYYEVVQMYRTELRLENARRLLFIPFRPLDFSDEEVILRYRGALLAGIPDSYVRDLLLQATGTVNVSLELPRFPTFVPDEDERKFERMKAAKAAAKSRAIGIAKLKILFARARAAGAVIRTTDAEASSWDMPGEVALINVGWKAETNRVQRLRVNLESGSHHDVASNGFGRNDNAVNPDLGSAIPVNRLASIDVIFAEDTAPEQQAFDLRFLVGNRALTLPCSVVLPAGRSARRLLRFEPPVPIADVSQLLAQDALYYSQIVWLNTDPNELVTHLAGLSHDGRRVIEYIEPKPVTVLGNAIGFLWGDEDQPDWIAWKAKHSKSAAKDDLVPLPTDGVFAEAVLGRFNASEKLDMSRFWNWQDSPIPVQAPDIAAIQAGQREGVIAAPAGNLEGQVINVMTPRDLPAPTGLVPALAALSAASMFRDMSGAAGVAAINQAGLVAAASGATAAGTQAGANMATIGEFSIEALRAMMPLIGAAAGIPVAPAPGGTNISNAGAVANEAAKLDAVAGATAGVAPSVANVTTGGSGGAGGVGAGGAGGNATSTGGGAATRSMAGGSPPTLREEIVRSTAGLSQRPLETPPVRDVVLNFVFRNSESNPMNGRFDMVFSKDGIVVDGVERSRANPLERSNVDFVLGRHFEELTLTDVPGPLFVQMSGEPLLGPSTGTILEGLSDPIVLPGRFTTYTINVNMGFDEIEVTATSRTEAVKALTGEIAFTIAGEPDTVPSGGARKPRLNKRPKAKPSLLSTMAGLIDMAISAKVGGGTTTTTGSSDEATFVCRVPTGALDIQLNEAGSA